MTRPTITKKAVLQLNGINPYIHISAAEAQTLQPQWRKPMPVCVQVNGRPEQPWHINMVPMGDGGFYLYLHNDVRRPAGVAVGDTVEVAVWFDETYQSGPPPLPEWFSQALQEHTAAHQAWQALSPSRQKEIVRYLSRLKSAQAKERNLRRVMQVLSNGPSHFLGRDWHQEN